MGSGGSDDVQICQEAETISKLIENSGRRKEGISILASPARRGNCQGQLCEERGYSND